MSSKRGSTVIFITLLCMVVLGLGAFVGWQWHNQQMENLRLDNLSLQSTVEELKSQTINCPVTETTEPEATPPAQIDLDLDISTSSATISAF